jgi:hypothetical protein
MDKDPQPALQKGFSKGQNADRSSCLSGKISYRRQDTSNGFGLLQTLTSKTLIGEWMAQAWEVPLGNPGVDGISVHEKTGGGSYFEVVN